VIAKFDDFASDTDAYMYHCHMANHEDGGMMGQFLVSKNPAGLERNAKGAISFRAKVEHPVTAAMADAAAKQALTPAPAFSGKTSDGGSVSLASLSATKPVVLYFIEKECPCSRDAAVYLERVQAAYGKDVTIIGVINATPAEARTWSTSAKATFPVITDEDCAIIHAYKAERSVSSTIIASGGGIVKAYPGYSVQTLEDLSTQVAKLLNKPVRKISTEGAPVKLTAGCTFPE
jgi:peroxiredoxin